MSIILKFGNDELFQKNNKRAEFAFNIDKVCTQATSSLSSNEFSTAKFKRT